MSGMETEEVVMAQHSHKSVVRKRGYLLNLNLKVLALESGKAM